MVQRLRHVPLVCEMRRSNLEALSGHCFFVRDAWSLLLMDYTGRVEIEGVKYAIRPGTACLIPPDMERTYMLSGAAIHRMAHFTWPPDKTAPTPRLYDVGHAFMALCQAFDEGILYAAEQRERAQARLWDILWQIVSSQPMERKPVQPLHPALVVAVRHIEQNLDRFLTVTAVSRAAEISHNHLIRLFRREYGLTPTGYIKRRRLHLVRYLLQHSNLPIKVIAGQVGVPDLQQFNHLVHRACGCSPTALREGRAK